MVFSILLLLITPVSSDSNHFVHSISPSSGSVGKAAAGLISSLPWNSFVLVYEKAKDLVEITSLLSVYYNEHGTRTAIRVLQLPPSFDYYDSFLKYTREQLRQTNLVRDLLFLFTIKV